jgi:hypothetical protein
VGSYDITWKRKHMMLVFEIDFDIFQEKKVGVFATTFSPLGLTLFNLIFVLLAI